MIIINNDKTFRLNLTAENNFLTPVRKSSSSIMDITGTKLDKKNKVLHVIIPSKVIENYNHIFINADTSVEDRMLDKTAWRILDY